TGLVDIVNCKHVEFQWKTHTFVNVQIVSRQCGQCQWPIGHVTRRTWFGGILACPITADCTDGIVDQVWIRDRTSESCNCPTSNLIDCNAWTQRTNASMDCPAWYLDPAG